jgi:hypothetical protein
MRDDLKRILDVVSGGGSLVDALAVESLKPFEFFKELDLNPQLSDAYARAVRTRAEIMVDEILTISDHDPDWGRAKLRVDTRKWIASKLNPRVYGDRLDVNVNQTIDIGSALTEARQRAVGGSTELIDITPQLIDGATGSKPVDSEEAIEIESIDIFS